MDDILITDASPTDHAQHLRALFSCVQDHEFIVHPEKCQFRKSQLHFLTHVLDYTGICPLPCRVTAICHFLQPATVFQLWDFLGLLNFYHHFLPGAAVVL